MQTKSMFFKGNPVKSFDEDGKPCQGTRIYSGTVIVRFKDGYLDGDTVIDGKIIVQPAVEAEGHLEFWRNGVPHRDSGFPAISTSGFAEHEYWEKGERLQ